MAIHIKASCWRYYLKFAKSSAIRVEAHLIMILIFKAYRFDKIWDGPEQQLFQACSLFVVKVCLVPF